MSGFIKLLGNSVSFPFPRCCHGKVLLVWASPCVASNSWESQVNMQVVVPSPSVKLLGLNPVELAKRSSDIGNDKVLFVFVSTSSCELLLSAFNYFI